MSSSIVVYCQTCGKRKHVCRCTHPAWAQREEATTSVVGSTIGGTIGLIVAACVGIPLLLTIGLLLLLALL